MLHNNDNYTAQNIITKFNFGWNARNTNVVLRNNFGEVD